MRCATSKRGRGRRRREEVRDGMRRMLMIPYRMEAFMYIHVLYGHVSLLSPSVTVFFQHNTIHAGSKGEIHVPRCIVMSVVTPPAKEVYLLEMEQRHIFPKFSSCVAWRIR